MNRNSKIALFVAGTIAVLGVTGVAVAGKRMHHGMGMGMGGHENLMERYDANKDAKVNQEEIDTNRTDTYATYDADKNAAISLEEFKNLWLKANNDRMVREFQHFDVDANSQVTLDEYKKPMVSMVADMDQNQDGFLTAEDHPRGGKHKRKGYGNHQNGEYGQEAN